MTHLEPFTSSRGFDHFPPIQGRHQATVSVYESSNASGPHLWMGVMEPADLNDAATGLPYEGVWKEATIQLTAEAAWKLADQLRHAVVTHYQGNARPDWATT